MSRMILFAVTVQSVMQCLTPRGNGCHARRQMTKNFGCAFNVGPLYLPRIVLSALEEYWTLGL
eukprot:11134840-Karenia_brevis.AAC.1